MHELSICTSLVEIILSEMNKLDPPPRKLLKASVAIGKLRQIVPEFLQSAYACLIPGTPAEGSVLEFRELPIKGRCRACGNENLVNDFVFQCAACHGADLEIEQGMELYLESLEVDN